jgi:hypothetical protein
MSIFKELPTKTPAEAHQFWLDKLTEYRKSAEFLAFDESGQAKKYLDIIPYVEAAINALFFQRATLISKRDSKKSKNK